MPTFLMIGNDSRLALISDLAAIAEVDPIDDAGLRAFEATWQGQILRVETPIVRDLNVVAARSAVADYLLLVISELDGPMPVDKQELDSTPARVELAAVCSHPVNDDPDVSALVRLETRDLIKTGRPRWADRFVHEACDIFFFLLKRSFFTDCL